MKLKLVLAALIIAPLALTACSKKEEASKAQAEASAPADEATTAEQQAAIDALDKPILDEKNQDVPAEVANAPADEATADAETAPAEQAAH